MAPVRSYSNWNSRSSDAQPQIEPFRKYFFICEGANTETWYFKRLIDNRKNLNIHSLIELCLLEKTGEDRNISYPKRLIEFADQQKDNPEIWFDRNRDKMVVVFDADIFESKVSDLEALISEAEKENIVAITNPAFELFLLLHYEDAYEQDILPNEEEIIRNEKNGNQTFIYSLLLKRTGLNSKKNKAIGDLADRVQIAIEQEKKVNQNIHECKGRITSNIGKVIEEICKDNG